MNETIRRLLRAPRFGMFLSVGIVGATIDNVSLLVIVESTGIAPVAAAVVSKELSIATMFFVNDRWTFSEFDEGHWLRRFVKSNINRLGGATVGITVLYVTHTWLGTWYVAANVLGIGAGFVVNYIAECLITWRVQD